LLALTLASQVIQLQGDQRANIRKFLIDEELAKASAVKVHGF